MSNNDFFSWNGTLDRKNYSINLFILTALYILLSLVRFDVILQFSKISLLNSIFYFLLEILKFLLMMSALSVVYRRIRDISYFKSLKFANNMKNMFIFVFVIPILYLFCLRYFLNFPLITNILDLVVLFVLIPLELIFAVVLCFIKGKKS